MVNCFPRARAARVPISALAVSVRTSGRPRSTPMLPTALLTLLLLLWSGVAGALPEVWMGSSARAHVDRYDISGSHLGDISAPNGLYGYETIAVVGSEVWMGSSARAHVDRYDISGSHLGDISAPTGLYGYETIATIPEPNTALLLGLGLSALAVRRENR